MTTLTLTPTNQVLHVPTSWADVTLGTFVALLAPDPDDERTAAELLLGLEAGALDQLAADDVVYISTLLAFSQDVTLVTELPATMRLPDPGSLPWGAMLLVQQHVAAVPEGRGELAALPYVLAVYRATLRDGKPDRADELLPHLLAAPCTETVPDGLHFLGGSRKLLSATSPTRQTSTSRRMPNSMLTRTRQFLNGLGLPWPWTRSQAGT